jgi:hypothetical protein
MAVLRHQARKRSSQCALQRGFALLAALAASPAVPAAESVQDLSYGVTLYHFYQQHYFDALTELTAAQQLQRLPNHGEQAELLRGGMSLSYGLDGVARQVFTDLLSQPTSGVDADLAWFYLGKLAWQRNKGDDSREALAMMAPDYSGPVADEANFLRAMQALSDADESGAQRYMGQLQQPCPWQSYYFYNLGALRAATGDWQGATQAFGQPGQFACNDAESALLADRSFSAAGYAGLSHGDTQQARESFVRVRLASAESDRALLGYGWSFANDGDYLSALGPWQQLAQRPPMNASVRESLLAVPFAYEQLQRRSAALQHYQRAADQFADELSRLQGVTGQIREQDLLQVFGLDDVDKQDWLGGADIAPQLRHAPWLQQLLSTDSVQTALRELRDLNGLDRQLQRAAQRLQVLQQVSLEQQQSWASVREEGRAEALANRRDTLQASARQLQRKIDNALRSGDNRALATTDQLGRWQRLETAQQRAQQLNDDTALHKLRLMRGLLQWQDSENYPDLLWRLRRSQQQLQGLLQQSDQALAAVDEAVATHDDAVFDQRIALLQQQLQQRQSRLVAVQQLAQDSLRDVVVAELEQQENHLAHSLGQARLAAARLYDLASPEVPR